ncbi:MerR family transcriptional regulator [Streptomyces koyangensis]|uniref:MerR family transcriptional regulator n=1 Tax=Streptomyces koyangensis TaxID=188770 RepID=A0A385D7X0_9ACTN|nr:MULTISPECIES: MerR family transcriptional regulator [Streptomyces]AXQ53797.1 MerR family transcriptional regulator [Streptomyces koyangensis]PKR44876.1 MerR family transcriptional regulator [Streptomyces sp. EAG2]
MRIGEMVRRTGVSERLLRYYEEPGPLTPDRLSSGYRVYAEKDVETGRRVRTLLTAGLTTATIARVLPCVGEEGEQLMPVCADLLSSRTILDGVIEAPGTARPGGG